MFQYGVDISLADGERCDVGVIGVDSGTAAIAAVGGCDDGIDPNRVYGDGWVSTSTYGGDGGFGVCTVTDPSGRVTAVEVVYYSPKVQAAADRLIEAAGLVEPSDEMNNQCYANLGHEGSEHARDVHDLYNQYWSACATYWEQAWDETVPGTHPAEEGVPHLVGEIRSTDQFAVGDPSTQGWTDGYSVHSGDVTIDVEPDTWQVIVWTEPDDHRLLRPLRVGVYRR